MGISRAFNVTPQIESRLRMCLFFPVFLEDLMLLYTDSIRLQQTFTVGLNTKATKTSLKNRDFILYK